MGSKRRKENEGVISTALDTIFAPFELVSDYFGFTIDVLESSIEGFRGIGRRRRRGV